VTLHSTLLTFQYSLEFVNTSAGGKKETLIRPSGTFSHPAPLALRSTGERDDI
jgi:hypothetical protein